MKFDKSPKVYAKYAKFNFQHDYRFQFSILSWFKCLVSGNHCIDFLNTTSLRDRINILHQKNDSMGAMKYA